MCGLYSNHSAADENGLFKHLDDASHHDNVIPDELNVADLFGSWSNQKGFPLVTLIRNDNGSITLHQAKYSAYASSGVDKSSWWIPYNLASAQNPIFDKTLPSNWMAQGEQTKLINSADEHDIKWSNSDWIVLNRQQTGYYRIQYDAKNYDLIMKELTDGDMNKIHPINRAQIIDDLHEFIVRERLSAKYLCNALNYLSREHSYAPWQAANYIINDWNRNFQVSKKFKTFQAIIGKSVTAYYEHLTLDEATNEPILNKLARNIAVNLACEFGVLKCVQDTYKAFQKLISGIQTKPNIRAIVISNGIRSADDGEIAKLWSLFLDNADQEERLEIISSLGNIVRDATLREYLQKSIGDFNGKTVRPTERTKIITSIASRNQRGLTLTIEFLANELENVQNTIGFVPSILHTIGRYILTDETDTKVMGNGIQQIT